MSSAAVLRPDWPASDHVRALSTTRYGIDLGDAAQPQSGALSQPPYSGLNLGDHVGDEPAAVAANRQRLRTAMALPAEPCWLSQVHGTRVVDAASTRPTLPAIEADASVSDRPGVVCAVMTADCLPILLCDRAGHRVAAVHAGWRGLAAGMVEASIAAMQCPPEELLAWIGPAIGPDAFEVGDEVRQAFVVTDTGIDSAAERCFKPPPAASTELAPHWLADLPGLARLRLQGSGVTAIYGGQWCTWSEPQRFYSYRRDGRTGRQASLIWIDAD